MGLFQLGAIGAKGRQTKIQPPPAAHHEGRRANPNPGGLFWAAAAERSAELTACGCAKVYREKASGARSDRAELAKVLRRPEPGDVLIVTRLDYAVPAACWGTGLFRFRPSADLAIPTKLEPTGASRTTIHCGCGW
jgi:hypothetical protein